MLRCEYILIVFRLTKNMLDKSYVEKTVDHIEYCCTIAGNFYIFYTRRFDCDSFPI